MKSYIRNKHEGVFSFRDGSYFLFNISQTFRKYFINRYALEYVYIKRNRRNMFDGDTLGGVVYE